MNAYILFLNQPASFAFETIVQRDVKFLYPFPFIHRTPCYVLPGRLAGAQLSHKYHKSIRRNVRLLVLTNACLQLKDLLNREWMRLITRVTYVLFKGKLNNSKSKRQKNLKKFCFITSRGFRAEKRGWELKR